MVHFSLFKSLRCRERNCALSFFGCGACINGKFRHPKESECEISFGARVALRAGPLCNSDAMLAAH